MSKLVDLLNQDIRKIRRPEWESADYLELPNRNTNGEFYKYARLNMDGVFVSMTVESADDGKDDWEAVPEPEPKLIDDRPYFNGLIPIPFEYTKNYRLRFGPKNYVGRTLDEIARQDDGLKYLDQLLGQDWVFQDTKDIIKAYLGNEAIKRDLESLLQ
jgi:hypothetical protein